MSKKDNFIWAAPSWTRPGSIWQNAQAMAGHVPSIGLCLFETGQCLKYDKKDLPATLSSLPFTWHVHLPLDLPWQSGAETVANICLKLLSKTSFLEPALAVLHPPENSEQLAQFARCWTSSTPIVLENTKQCDIISLGEDFLNKNRFGFCLDVGHALGYSQTRLLDSSLPNKAAIFHWHAFGAHDSHLPLTAWENEDLEMAESLAAKAGKDTIHMLEIFSWPDIEKSLPILRNLLSQGQCKNDYQN